LLSWSDLNPTGIAQEPIRFLVDDADLDEAGDTGFPFGGGAGHVVLVTVFCALEQAQDRADEAALTDRELGPAFLNCDIFCLHALYYKTGRGTKLGLHSQIFWKFIQNCPYWTREKGERKLQTSRSKLQRNIKIQEPSRLAIERGVWKMRTVAREKRVETAN
jgi:hypothetical protein